MEKIPKISVIIPSLDGYRDGNVEGLISDLKEQTLKDIEIKLIKAVSPNGKARNIGAKDAKGEILVFIDDDIRLGHNRVLENIIKALEADDRLAMTGASVRIREDSRYIHKEYDKIRNFSSPIKDTIDYDGRVGHACLAIKKSVFEEIGGENEDLIRGTDVDLNNRIKAKGYRVAVVPKAWVYHLMPNSIIKLLKEVFNCGLGAAYAVKIKPEIFGLPKIKFINYAIKTKMGALIYTIANTLIRLLVYILIFKPVRFLFYFFNAIGYVYGWLKFRISKKLSGSDKEYWDSIYRLKLGTLKSERDLSESSFKILIKKLIGKEVVEYIREYIIRSYTDYLLWDVIYKEYMPKIKGLKVIEIGSAPGDTLIRLNQKFDFVPYGVDYSEIGIELNRKLFISHNINPDNAIYADFFSDEFHKQYKGSFDIVISNGFIEHFMDVKDVVKKHIDLLVKGGYLIVTIPNLKGINYILARIFYKGFLPMLNTDIMQRGKFSEIFDKEHLRFLFCDYYGVFDFNLFASKEIFSLLRIILKFCNILQLILNLLFRRLFKDGKVKSSLFSPYLIFIGVRR